MAAVGLLTAEFIEAAEDKTAQVVRPAVLRPGLNLHAPHVDFHDAILVLPFDDDRRDSQLIVRNPIPLDFS